MGVLLAAVSVIGSGSSVVGQATGRIVGTVFDSTTSSPLANARVAVVGTDAVAESDENGQFRLDGVPAGQRSVVFFHRRLGTLGVAMTPASVLVNSGSPTRVALTIPSRSTILSAWCSAEPGEGTTSVGGVVTDALTGVPLPRATVRALGSRAGVDSLTVFSNEALGLEIELATRAIALKPLVVVGRREEPIFTTPGTRFSGLTEAQVDSIAHRVVDFAGIARAARAPGFSITEVILRGQEILCIETRRNWRSGDPNSCNMVLVLIDDAVVSNPQFFLQHLNPRDVRRIQYITPVEAGVLYGTRGASGVLLIYTR